MSSYQSLADIASNRGEGVEDPNLSSGKKKYINVLKNYSHIQCILYMDVLTHNWSPAMPSQTKQPGPGCLDNAIHQISHYPVDSVVYFANTYLLDSDSSGG